MQDLKHRQFWMATLAKAALPQLEQQLRELGDLPKYDFLRPPEIGLTLIQGRTGGTGEPFYLGEITLTRCVVRLNTPNENQPITGFGYVAGRSHRHAELAALCDALLQHPDWSATVQAIVIDPLCMAAQRQRQQQQRQVESTRVNFFTLVRGESC